MGNVGLFDEKNTYLFTVFTSVNKILSQGELTLENMEFDDNGNLKLKSKSFLIKDPLLCIYPSTVSHKSILLSNLRIKDSVTNFNITLKQFYETVSQLDDNETLILYNIALLEAIYGYSLYDYLHNGLLDEDIVNTAQLNFNYEATEFKDLNSIIYKENTIPTTINVNLFLSALKTYIIYIYEQIVAQYRFDKQLYLFKLMNDNGEEEIDLKFYYLESVNDIIKDSINDLTCYSIDKEGNIEVHTWENGSLEVKQFFISVFKQAYIYYSTFSYIDFIQQFYKKDDDSAYQFSASKLYIPSSLQIIQNKELEFIQNGDITIQQTRPIIYKQGNTIEILPIDESSPLNIHINHLSYCPSNIYIEGFIEVVYDDTSGNIRYIINTYRFYPNHSYVTENLSPSVNIDSDTGEFFISLDFPYQVYCIPRINRIHLYLRQGLDSYNAVYGDIADISTGIGYITYDIIGVEDQTVSNKYIFRMLAKEWDNTAQETHYWYFIARLL